MNNISDIIINYFEQPTTEVLTNQQYEDKINDLILNQQWSKARELIYDQVKFNMSDLTTLTTII